MVLPFSAAIVTTVWAASLSRTDDKVKARQVDSTREPGVLAETVNISNHLTLFLVGVLAQLLFLVADQIKQAVTHGAPSDTDKQRTGSGAAHHFQIASRDAKEIGGLLGIQLPVKIGAGGCYRG